MLRLALGSLAAVVGTGCGGTLDAGSDRAPGDLPVDARNPMILCNDGAHDNWQGEYALLLAERGGPALAGIVVSAGTSWPNLDENFAGWSELVARARASGLGNPPEPIRSASSALTRPDDGIIASTVANDSSGARFIVETSSRLGSAERPVVVVTGGRLTDVADAYLLDPSVAERVVVVASLGTGFVAGEQVARMGIPNGEMDSWADAIVAQRFRYVQVSAYYDPLTDVPAERVVELPDNPFGAWMREKQPSILTIHEATDQVSVLAVGLPEFTRTVTRASWAGSGGNEPTLVEDPKGRAWVITASNSAAATQRLWQALLDPATFGK